MVDEHTGDEVILNSSAVKHTDEHDNPIPVTIPIALAPGISVIYTTRLGGVSESGFTSLNLGGKGGDNPEHVRANREALGKQLGAHLSLISQVHSGIAVDIDDTFTPNATFGFDASGTHGTDLHPTVIEADAQVTSRGGIALGIFAADCLPVLLADPTVGVIGAAHCGRRGLQAGVIGATVEKMVAKGARPERMVATLGPAICGDCYETGDEIADEFDGQFAGTFTLTRFGKPGIDISAAALAELERAGIPRDSIISSRPRITAATQYLAEDPELAELCDSDGEGESLAERIANIRHSMCTLENPLWFSHRRTTLANKTNEGRMLALIVRQ